MQIELRRLKANHLYTEGQILINDLVTIPYAVEHTLSMLPIGEYHIRLAKDKKRRRVIGIFLPKVKGKSLNSHPSSLNSHPSSLNSHPSSLNHKPSSLNLLEYFEPGHSFLSAKAHGTIIIGELLIPGSVQKGREHYDRLFDRIEKCEQRGEPITLTITDDCCKESTPIRHWLT